MFPGDGSHNSPSEYLVDGAAQPSPKRARAENEQMTTHIVQGNALNLPYASGIAQTAIFILRHIVV